MRSRHGCENAWLGSYTSQLKTEPAPPPHVASSAVTMPSEAIAMSTVHKARPGRGKATESCGPSIATNSSGAPSTPPGLPAAPRLASAVAASVAPPSAEASASGEAMPPSVEASGAAIVASGAASTAPSGAASAARLARGVGSGVGGHERPGRVLHAAARRRR